MGLPSAVRRRLDSSERFSLRLSGAAVGVLLVVVPGSLLVLSVVTRWSPVVDWDAQVEEAVHRVVLAHPPLQSGATAVTHLGDTMTRTVVTVVAVAVLAWRRAWRGAVFLGTVVPLGGLIDTVVKWAVDRARPVMAEPITAAPGASFPSGHAMGATVVYGALLFVFLPFLPVAVRRPLQWLTGAVIVAVGVSRVLLGVHFPTDVLAGWLMGVAWLGLATALFRRWRRPSAG